MGKVLVPSSAPPVLNPAQNECLGSSLVWMRRMHDYPAERPTAVFCSADLWPAHLKPAVPPSWFNELFKCGSGTVTRLPPLVYRRFYVYLFQISTEILLWLSCRRAATDKFSYEEPAMCQSSSSTSSYEAKFQSRIHRCLIFWKTKLRTCCWYSWLTKLNLDLPQVFADCFKTQSHRWAFPLRLLGRISRYLRIRTSRNPELAL